MHSRGLRSLMRTNLAAGFTVPASCVQSLVNKP
jgi:hypothetical protein